MLYQKSRHGDDAVIGNILGFKKNLPNLMPADGLRADTASLILKYRPKLLCPLARSMLACHRRSRFRAAIVSMSFVRYRNLLLGEDISYR